MSNFTMKASTLLCAGLFSCAAIASNCSFFINSAQTFFTKEDWKLSKAAQVEALNHYKDGQKIVWKNPQTGSSGVFFPSHTTNEKGGICRHLKMVSSAHLQHEKATYRYCKFNDEWKIM